MVERMGLVVMQVLEVGSILVAKVEWHVGVTIINSVQVSAFQELLDVVFNDWGLIDGSSLSTGDFTSDTISESEDVLKTLVL